MADAAQVLKPVPNAKPTRLWWAYEATMAALALVVVWLFTVPDQGWARVANLGIWAIFVVDYGVRLAIADDRRRFVRSNIPDLIAILPLDFLRVARLARLARLTRLLRAGTVLWRISTNVRGVLGTNGLGYLLLATAALVIGGGFAAWAAEDQLESFGDGLWWALVTATTVGYGDISPVTLQGRLVATVLMLVGIGTLGMITGSIATYFLGQHRKEPGNPQVEWLREQLAGWDDLPAVERRRLAAMLGGLAQEGEGSGLVLSQDQEVRAATSDNQ
ncbi:MAG TPA: potassium channel family protein [Chloroflexota bacterium]|nr:potassium channel family protein [Chloroflexota bacterium]